MADVAHEITPRAVPTPLVQPAQVPRSIVPLAGIPIIAIVLIALVAAIASDKLWPIEFFHVAAGGIWTALDLFIGLVLGPILGSMSPAARVELTRRLMPKLALIMPTLVVCTLAAGWQLGHYLGTIDSAYFNHGWIVASYIVVGVMAVIALGINEPANVAVLFELRKPEPRGEVVGRLMKRFMYTAGITGVMQIATLVIMTKVSVG